MKMGDYVPALSDVVQNILDDPIAEKVNQQLLKPLGPCRGGKPVAPLTASPGFGKILNSSLPLGQVALKFCLPQSSLSLLF